MTQEHKEKLLLKPMEVANTLGIARSRAYMLIASNVIPNIRIGRSVRVPRVALEQWIEQQLVEQASER